MIYSSNIGHPPAITAHVGPVKITKAPAPRPYSYLFEEWRMYAITTCIVALGKTFFPTAYTTPRRNNSQTQKPKLTLPSLTHWWAIGCCG